MSLKINSVGLNNNLARDLNRNTLSLARSIYSMPALVPQFKDGGPVKPQGAMQFKGPGTGKSDSIDAKLPVQGFVLPVEVVQSIGADKLKAMIALFDTESAAEDQAEGQEEVSAKVSNGEVWVPPEVVQKTGPEYWDGLIASITGKGARPEIGEHGEMMAAGGGLMDERMEAQQFWQNATSTPAPIPGRANPPNPADLMTDRLATSGGNLAQQAPRLREQMAQQGQSLSQPVTPVQTTGPLRPQIPAFTTPDPHRNPLKNANTMMGGEGAIATSLAYDVLNSPQNTWQVNGAIAGLKQRAGFDPNSTPYPELKDASLGYAKGGEVKGYAEGDLVTKNGIPIDTYPADPKRFGWQGVPSTRQMTPYVERGTNMVPTGQGNMPRIREPVASTRTVPSVPENYAQQNFTVKPDTNPGGTMNANRALVPSAAVPQSKVATDPWTGSAPGSGFANKFGAGLKSFINAPGLRQAAIETVKDPSTQYLAADAVNEALKNRALNQGDIGQAVARTPLSLAGGRGAQQIAASIVGKPGEGPAMKAFGNVVEALTPTPEIIRHGRFGQQTETNGAKNQVQTPQAPVTRDQTPQTPVQGALPPAIGKAANWNETGYRTDDAPQTLAWNESRWSNSGDPVQDAALAERQGNLASLRQQANLMQQNPQIAGALNPAAAILPQTLQEQKRQNDVTNTLERDRMAQPAPRKYAASDGQVYQQEGVGAQEFNQGAMKNVSGAQKAWTRFFDQSTTPEQQTELSKWLAENDPHAWLNYQRKQN